MPEPASPQTCLTSPRLLLRAPAPSMAEALVDYERRNEAHLSRWAPPAPPRLFEVEWQREEAAREQAGWTDGKSWRWWLALRTDSDRIVGSARFSQIARGPFQNAMLGYHLDGALQGQGLMAEALRAAIDELFSPAVRLHRIQANVRPENTRSLALLDRLGFEREGFAREYLFIDGGWRDHVLTALRNPRYEGPPAAG